MQEHSEQRYIQEDEIDLREIVRTVVKHKKFVIIFTLIVTLLAGAYAFLKTPMYDVKSNIQIGFIGKNLVAAPASIVKTLKVVFNVDEKPDNKKKIISDVKSITQKKQINNFIEVVTEGISNAEALKKSNEVLTYLQNLYASKIEQYKAETQDKIKALKLEINQIKMLDKKNIENQIDIITSQKIPQVETKINLTKGVELKTIEKKISYNAKKLNEYNEEVKKIAHNTSKITNETSLMIASIQMVNYQNMILNLQNKIENLKTSKEKLIKEVIPNLQRAKENLLNGELRQLKYKLNYGLRNKIEQLNNQIQSLEYRISSQNIQNSTLVGKNIVKDYPASPKKKLIIVVAFVTGLVLSIFLVFFLEFIKTFKEEGQTA